MRKDLIGFSTIMLWIALYFLNMYFLFSTLTGEAISKIDPLSSAHGLSVLGTVLYIIFFAAVIIVGKVKGSKLLLYMALVQGLFLVYAGVVIMLAAFASTPAAFNIALYSLLVILAPFFGLGVKIGVFSLFYLLPVICIVLIVIPAIYIRRFSSK
ncbi:MAG: hypothetical protein Q8882_07965 [Bacillota bacterium]|nr:hypothetical protein [Bacillota bacterium]